MEVFSLVGIIVKGTQFVLTIGTNSTMYAITCCAKYMFRNVISLKYQDSFYELRTAKADSNLLVHSYMKIVLGHNDHIGLGTGVKEGRASQ